MHRVIIQHAARWLRPTVCLAVMTLAGCAGYRVGAPTLYSQQIKTVYVPMFESTSYRRNLGERLTEAVIKEIERTTPFKVVQDPTADSVLTGKLISDTKRLIMNSPTSEARELEVNFAVLITWTNRNGEILHEQAVPIPAETATINQSAGFVPEVGQSLVTAQNAALQRVAKQIVSIMEVPW